MSFKMIDADAAIAAMATLTIGEFAFVENPPNRQYFKVLEKGQFDVTLEATSGKIRVPISLMTAYVKEMEMRMQIDGTEKRPRGRPPGSKTVGAAAPVDHPLSAQDRPAAGLAEALAQAGAAPINTPVSRSPADQLPSELDTTPQTAGEWASDQIAQLLQQMGQDFAEIIAAAIAQTESDSLPKTVSTSEVKTCLDCQHSDITNSMCKKVNLTPPMRIVAQASKMCMDFLPDEIPY